MDEKRWTHENDPEYTSDPELNRLMFLAKAMEHRPRPMTKTEPSPEQTRPMTKTEPSPEQTTRGDDTYWFVAGMLIFLIFFVALIGLSGA